MAGNETDRIILEKIQELEKAQAVNESVISEVRSHLSSMDKFLGEIRDLLTAEKVARSGQDERIVTALVNGKATAGQLEAFKNKFFWWGFGIAGTLILFELQIIVGLVYFIAGKT